MNKNYATLRNLAESTYMEKNRITSKNLYNIIVTDFMAFNAFQKMKNGYKLPLEEFDRSMSQNMKTKILPEIFAMIPNDYDFTYLIQEWYKFHTNDFIGPNSTDVFLLMSDYKNVKNLEELFDTDVVIDLYQSLRTKKRISALTRIKLNIMRYIAKYDAITVAKYILYTMAFNGPYAPYVFTFYISHFVLSNVMYAMDQIRRLTPQLTSGNNMFKRILNGIFNIFLTTILPNFVTTWTVGSVAKYFGVNTFKTILLTWTLSQITAIFQPFTHLRTFLKYFETPQYTVVESTLGTIKSLFI